MRTYLTDDHFRAAAVPSRTQDPEAVVLWDGRATAFPLRVELMEGASGREALVIDADGRELRRFATSADAEDPATLAARLIDRLDQLRLTGQEATDRRPTEPAPTESPARSQQRAPRPSVTPGRIAGLVGTGLVVMFAGLLGVILAASNESSSTDENPTPTSEEAPAPVATDEPQEMTPIVPAQPEAPAASSRPRDRLMELLQAQRARFAAEGAYAEDASTLGLTSDEVVVRVLNTSPTGFTATASLPPTKCKMTVEGEADPSIDCITTNP